MHLGIECNKVTKNSTLILFLSFFSLHSMLFIPCYSYLFLCISFYSSTPFSVSMGLCFVRCGLLAPHAAHPFFLQSGWRPSGRAHYFTILPSPSLKLPLSNSALPNQTLGGIASGLGMQNLNSSRQVRLLGEIPRGISALLE